MAFKWIPSHAGTYRREVADDLGEVGGWGTQVGMAVVEDIDVLSRKIFTEINGQKINKSSMDIKASQKRTSTVLRLQTGHPAGVKSNRWD